MKSIYLKTMGRHLALKDSIIAFMACLSIIFLSFISTAKAQTTEPYTWGNVAMGGGGFVSGIITSRSATGPVYVRTDVGGAYRWDSHTAKWLPLTDFASEDQQGVMGTLSMAIDPNHLNVVYVMAGISYFNNGKSYILRSIDSGATFTVTDVTAKFKVNGNGMGRQDGERLQVDPNDSTTLYCGSQANGLFKSTDKGSTWNATSLPVTTTPNANGVSFVLVDKYNGLSGTQSKTIFAGVSRMGSNQNFYRSDNAGSTFTAIDNTALPDSLMPQRAVITNNGAYIYITYGNGAGPSGTTAEPYTKGQIWRYTVAGGAWTNVTPAGITRAFSGIDIDLANNNRLIVSTCNTYFTQSPGVYGDRFYLTTDGGTTWTDIVVRGFSIDDNGVPWLANASIHWAGCIKFDPANTNRVMVTSGNGTFVNENITNSAGVWKVNVKGIEEVVPRNLVTITGGGPVVSVISDYDGFTQSDPTVYASQRHTPTMGSTTALDYAVTNKKVVRAASSMYYSTDMGYTWTETGVINGNNGQVALSPDGNTLLHCPSGSTYIYRSTNNGTSWSSVNINFSDARPVADGLTNGKFYYYNNSTTNPGLYVSTNGGASFAKSSGTLASGGSKIIRSVPTYDGDVWVALNGGGLVYTQDAGATFTTVANITSCSAVGIGKAQVCYAYPAIYIWGSYNGSANGIYRSYDKGVSWTRVNDDAHEYGGPGNGQFVMGDMNTVGAVYMSSAGRGVVYGTANPGLSATPATLTFSNAAGSQTFTAASNSYINVTKNQTWITVSPANGCPGSTFTVTVTANTGSTTRTGTISVYAGGLTRTVEINQNYNCTTTGITPYMQVNGGAWTQTATASLAPGGSVSMGPQPNTATGWDWTGPNGFTSTSRQIDLTNIRSNQGGTYVATYTNGGGCKSSQTFVITVTGGGGSFAAMLPPAQIAIQPVDAKPANTPAIVAYPNPVDQEVTVRIPEDMVGSKIKMANSSGVNVMEGNAAQLSFSINMSKMQPGLYVINLYNGKKTMSVKVIKR